jgi:hypothetical protein
MICYTTYSFYILCYCGPHLFMGRTLFLPNLDLIIGFLILRIKSLGLYVTLLSKLTIFYLSCFSFDTIASMSSNVS